MKIAMIVLSDIHITEKTDPVLTHADAIARCCFKYMHETDAVLLLLPGDIAYSGKSAQYALAKNFFHEVQTAFRKESQLPLHVVTTPGNHDCDFDLSTRARDYFLKAIRQGDEANSEMVSTCLDVQGAYAEFRDEIEHGNTVTGDGLWRTTEIVVKDKLISVESINMAWLSSLKEAAGTLAFPWTIYSTRTAPKTDLRIAIQHHPSNWLAQEWYRPYRAFLRNRANIVITGHEHAPNAGLNSDTESSQSIFLESGALQTTDGLANSSFMVMMVDDVEKKLSVERFKWSKDQVYLSEEKRDWDTDRALQPKFESPHKIKPEFLERINDSGLPLRSATNAEIRIDDFYIFPELSGQALADEELVSPTTTSRSLLEIHSIEAGVIVTGDEKSGKTSLMHQLFKGYVEQGFVPVIVSGKDIKRTQDAEVSKLLNDSYAMQYEASTIPFEQVPRDRRVVLIDDLDLSRLKKVFLGQVITNIFGRSAGLVIVCGKHFVVDKLELAGSPPRRLGIQPFGYKARNELIRRWHEFNDPYADEDEFVMKCDESERAVNHVMTKKVIPPLPLFIVTLLQSISVDRSRELIDSSLGYYYNYLITSAFAYARVPATKITEVYEYCAHLAWHFSPREESPEGIGADDAVAQFADESSLLEFSEAELRAFNTSYSAKWTKTEFSTRLNLLLDAKILERRGASFAFRYPYVYYYLKGKYLAGQMQEDEIRQYVTRCCKLLYVRDNANTVLFLAHHAQDDFFVRAVQASLDEVYPKFAPITFDGDTSDIAQLVEGSPKFDYKGGKPLEHRQRRAELSDRLDNGTDGLLNKPERGETQSPNAANAALFKTNEVLGLILKAQYSKFTHKRKHELLNSMFDGTMRGLHALYEGMVRQPQILQWGIEEVAADAGEVDLEDKDMQSKIRQIAALVVEVMGFAYVFHAAECARSPDLLDNVNEVVNARNATSFELVRAALLLDSGAALPRSELKQVKRRTSSNLVASRMLTFFVLYRLYMFETSEDDKLWASRQFGFRYGAAEQSGALASISGSLTGLIHGASSSD